MLVLSRKPGEKVQVGRDVVFTVLAVQGGRVRVGIDAPPDVAVLRTELREAAAAPLVRTEYPTQETDHATESSPQERRDRSRVARGRRAPASVRPARYGNRIALATVDLVEPRGAPCVGQALPGGGPPAAVRRGFRRRGRRRPWRGRASRPGLGRAGGAKGAGAATRRRIPAVFGMSVSRLRRNSPRPPAGSMIGVVKEEMS